MGCMVEDFQSPSHTNDPLSTRPASVNVIASTTYMRALCLPSVLPTLLSGSGPFVSPNASLCLSPLCSCHLSSFQPQSSVTWSIGKASTRVSSPVSCFSVPHSLCPRARFLNQTRPSTTVPPCKPLLASSSMASGRGRQAFS